MPYFLILLLLTACTAPKQEKTAEPEAVENPHLNKASIDEEVIYDWTKETNHYIEVVKIRRIPLTDASILPRLVRVQDNFTDFWDYCQYMLGKWKYKPEEFQLTNPEHILGYGEIFIDPKTTNYYAGLLSPLEEGRAKDTALPALSPTAYSNRMRLVFITNLSPYERLLADTANKNILYVQKIVYIVDFYKGVISQPAQFYLDPSNRVQLKVLPITNQEKGYVAYKGISPNSGRVFYAYRSPFFDPRTSNDTKDYYNNAFGELIGIRGTIEGIWEALEPPEEVSDI